MIRNTNSGAILLCLAACALTAGHAQPTEIVKKSTGGLAPDGNQVMNLFIDGDFESQPPEAACANATQDKEQDDAVHIYEGNPAKQDASHKGQYCLGLDLKSDKAVFSFSKPANLNVDPSKKYRLSVSFFIPTETVVLCTGYGYNGEGTQVLDEKGEIWGYRVLAKGPLDAWEKVEITIGPKDSSSDFVWPLETDRIGMNVYLRGEQGTVYLDDITLKEVQSGE